MSLGSVFLTAILPVLSVAVAGALLGWHTDLEVGPLNAVTIYVLVPALIFHSLVTTPVAVATAGKVFLGVFGYTAVMLLVARVVSRLRGRDRLGHSALVLASVFTNAGNYGIPLAAFAFGPVGRATAVLFLVAQNVLMYTVGVYVASRGDGSASREALGSVFRLPLVYAVAAASLVRALDLPLPPDGVVLRTVGLTGEAAIPVMLLVLGVELSNTRYGATAVDTGVASALKLVVAPAVGVGLALLLAFEDPTVARVFVLGCAAPTAITPLILAVEFLDVPLSDSVSVPEFVSATILVTTLASVAVLTVLIAVLQSGAVV